MRRKQLDNVDTGEVDDRTELQVGYESKPISWDDAINEATAQIRNHRRRILTLEGCLKAFKALKAEGTSFPGASKRASLERDQKRTPQEQLDGPPDRGGDTWDEHRGEP